MHVPRHSLASPSQRSSPIDGSLLIRETRERLRCRSCFQTLPAKMANTAEPRNKELIGKARPAPGGDGAFLVHTMAANPRERPCEPSGHPRPSLRPGTASSRCSSIPDVNRVHPYAHPSVSHPLPFKLHFPEVLAFHGACRGVVQQGIGLPICRWRLMKSASAYGTASPVTVVLSAIGPRELLVDVEVVPCTGGLASGKLFY